MKGLMVKLEGGDESSAEMWRGGGGTNVFPDESELGVYAENTSEDIYLQLCGCRQPER